ncbi:bifunctional diaminohydroxyphosphoribosylaminopyrimidine deaminase/5-amino-6-(5-phosphoribosylamino)uracil reductase RibD [Hansschlegelia zhihuaiae]|uniref:Riboflavin biosynthesis protein RibD n=1 Tax=Hansschlegelia zhihuaiae TaxID=405005 RepID=A0A4Q0MP66_9HYPH|nr:bifunctional diaminohydroxyphosphoribosylaminopyrimidine deaminase/5-amino-6-(5-phosphoribosylamino)uracil reductase RibD [Hansschlegelia zhihuaiae]
MKVALSLARRGLGRTAPNPSVGAVVVARDGTIVGRGWTQPGGRPHAEPIALAAAGAAARGATLYVTLEPCSHYGRTPPCVDAIVAAGVARVVAATGDPDPRVDGRGFARLRAAGIDVEAGVMREEATRLIAGHAARVALGRPFVTLKLAVSADGKVALPGGRPVAITCEASRARVHLMRAESDAILVGVGTVLADDPELTCRLPGMADRSPTRIVLDGGLRTPPASRLVIGAAGTPTWIVASADAPVEAERALRAAGAEVMRVERGPDGRLDLMAALGLLVDRGVARLMVEGGPTVASALLSPGLVDEAVILRGPAAIGAGAPAALASHALADLTATLGFAEVSRFRVGDDEWTVYERA